MTSTDVNPTSADVSATTAVATSTPAAAMTNVASTAVDVDLTTSAAVDDSVGDCELPTRVLNISDVLMQNRRPPRSLQDEFNDRLKMHLEDGDWVEVFHDDTLSATQGLLCGSMRTWKHGRAIKYRHLCLWCGWEGTCNDFRRCLSHLLGQRQEAKNEDLFKQVARLVNDPTKTIKPLAETSHAHKTPHFQKQVTQALLKAHTALVERGLNAVLESTTRRTCEEAQRPATIFQQSSVSTRQRRD